MFISQPFQMQVCRKLIQDMQSSPGSRAVTAKQKSIQQTYHGWQNKNKPKKTHPKQFSSIHRCPGTRQLLVMPIWSTTCRDGQLMLFGPHGTHEGFNWGSHPGGLPCTGASRSSESLTAGESACTTGLPSEPALGGGYHERLWARPPANCFSNSYALSL